MGSAIEIIDSNGEEMARGATGEIATYSPVNTRVYWQRPEETQKTLRDGWIHTCHADYMDTEGYIVIRDRIKDMAVTDTENVHSFDLEKVLAGHPAIVEATVIGVPDKKYGEAALAVCVPEADVDLNAGETIGYCRERIAGYKIPRQSEQEGQACCASALVDAIVVWHEPDLILAMCRYAQTPHQEIPY